MSFYRTYRPNTIVELDNPQVKERLLSLLSKDREKLPHAFLLYGPKGSGKTTTARIIAKLFNCTKLSKKTGPCGSCEHCLSVERGTNMDVVEIDAASNRGIDDIRLLRDRVNLTPTSGTYTVYIIDEVHMLTTEAFNALLKTLEEPPAHAIFILATTDPQKVIPTIRSRCIELPFRKATPEELVGTLSRIAKKEKLGADDQTLMLIAKKSDGAFRDAVKMLEQVSLGRQNITPDDVKSILSVSDDQTRRTFLDSVFAGKTSEAVSYITQFVSNGGDPKLLTIDCLSDLQTFLIAIAKGETHPSSWNDGKARDLTKRLLRAYADMQRSPAADLPLELAVLEFSAQGAGLPAPDRPVAAVNVQPPAKSPVPVTEIRVVPEKKASPLTAPEPVRPPVDPDELINLDKLSSHWPDLIAELKGFNHSVAGVLRSARPKSVGEGKVIIEAFYPFHRDRLSEPQVRDTLAGALKKLFGASVQVEIVLGTR